jgi:hypothetical protein
MLTFVPVLGPRRSHAFLRRSLVRDCIRRFSRLDQEQPWYRQDFGWIRIPCRTRDVSPRLVRHGFDFLQTSQDCTTGLRAPDKQHDGVPDGGVEACGSLVELAS